MAQELASRVDSATRACAALKDLWAAVCVAGDS